MSTIGDRFQEVRKGFHATQTSIASRLGVSSAHISQIEKGKNLPSDMLIKVFCKEFLVNEEWLRTGNGTMQMTGLEGEVMFQSKLGLGHGLTFDREDISPDESIKHKIYNISNLIEKLLFRDFKKSKSQFEYLVHLEFLMQDIYATVMQDAYATEFADCIDENREKADLQVKYMLSINNALQNMAKIVEKETSE